MSKADVDLKVDWASHEAAKFACENWHYSKTIPMPPLVKIGVWEDGHYIGVVIFSRGASSNLMKPYGLAHDEGCELTRVALTKHSVEVSRIVKLAISFLRRSNPRLRLIVSFADPHHGHHGGIYQAGNWIYAGDTTPATEYWYKGRRLHNRQVSESGIAKQYGKVTKVPKPSECKAVKLPGKHRYLMPLDKRMRKKVDSLSRPYPKKLCAGSEAVSRQSFQTEDGGSIPTSALMVGDV